MSFVHIDLKNSIHSLSKNFQRSLQFHHYLCQKLNFKTFKEFIPIKSNTVKLARAKLPANAGNFSWSSQAKRPHTQFTCVTCSLLVTADFTSVDEAGSSRRIHANCLQVHVNLPDYPRYLTSNFTCGTHANLPVTSMQNCPPLQPKIHAIFRRIHWNRRWKYTPNETKNNCKRRKKYPHRYKQKYLQFHTKLIATAGSLLSHRG